MIKAIITDFDGTLVDTFQANLKAYQKAFADNGRTLTAEEYRECFGLRYDRFMQVAGINDDREAECIREAKKRYYPEYFEFLRPNRSLIRLIEGFRTLGGKTAIASTARKENLMNVVNYLGIAGHFDLIFAGIDVRKGKPDPEIYLEAMAALGVIPDQTMIFEDSEVGIQAAKASGAYYMVVSPEQFKV